LRSKEDWSIGLAQRAKVQPCDPAEGLKNAVLAKAEQGAFGELNAVYVRKSSAELNLGK
jgi:hypothetical protein